MITFKEYLTEKLDVLNPKDISYHVLRQVYKTWDKERYKQLFVDFKDWGFVDKRSTRLYFNLNKKKPVSPPNNDVVQFLKEKGYEVINYSTGIIQKSDSKGKLVTSSIQSVLSKYKKKELETLYFKDPHHVDLKSNSSETDKYMVVISRHPYDIIGMASGREWAKRSCMNLKDGFYRKVVPVDVEQGSLVAYLIVASDKDIQDPVGRLTIRPYYADDKEIVLGVANKGYYPEDFDQTTRDLFMSRVVEWVDAVHKKQNLNGIFRIKAGLYDTEGEIIKSVGDMDIGDEDTRSIFLNPKSIGIIKNPTKKQQKLAVTINPRTIKYIFNPDEELQIIAVSDDGYNIDLIETDKGISENVQMAAVKEDLEAFEYVANLNPTEKVQLYVVSRRPDLIKHLKSPSLNVQLTAVKKDGLSIRKIQVKTSEQVQLAAFEQDERAINYIYEPSEKVIKLALSIDPYYLKFILQNGGKVSDDILEDVVSEEPEIIRYIDNPSERIQLAAVYSDINVLKSIRNPTNVVINAVNEYREIRDED